ncbi:MAG: DUF542 domain-containing protein [Gemmatimonadota bacterium]|nr:DUF542 domain-containing protein [Gemmatimonadota bacterium]
MSTDSRTERQSSVITADSTVDAVIAASPNATSILNAHNIDTCCGGRDSLAEAALRAHADLATLIPLLAIPPTGVPAAADATLPVKSCGCGCH